MKMIKKKTSPLKQSPSTRMVSVLALVLATTQQCGAGDREVLDLINLYPSTPYLTPYQACHLYQ